ncbi:MAG TPA: hypothetical protein VMT95_10025 [Candidatus Binatia bacterium]|nr:hypothetical protein [Candidatus Binatia bacterium]
MYRSLALRAGSLIALASVASPLAGCSGATSSLPTPISASSAAHALGSQAELNAEIQDAHHKKRKMTLLYVSDNENNEIRVYNASSKTQNPPVLRTITNGISEPNGITTDLKGNLYVANYFNNDVTVYAPNSSSPKATISNGMSNPWDVKVDGFGNVYVLNVPLYGGQNTINLYPAGSSNPSTTWYFPSGFTTSGIALLNSTMQGQTSIYALGYTVNPSTEIASGTDFTCFPGSANCTNLGGSFGQTGGIAVVQSPTSKPFEWIGVDQYIPGFDIFQSGQSTKQFATGGTPEFITMDSTDTKLFVADRMYGRVTEYSFPALTKLNTFNGGAQTYGVATYPAGTFH